LHKAGTHAKKVTLRNWYSWVNNDSITKRKYS